MIKKIITFVFVFIPFSLAVESKTAPVVLEIQSAFEKVKTIETNFEQIVRSSRFGEKLSSGKLLLERPGKMIWNYKDPKGKVFSTNGDIITLYDPEEKQALVSPQPKDGQLPAGFSFLMGQSNLTSAFNVEILSDAKNAKGHRQVALLCKPKGEISEFKTLELTFEWSPNIVLVSSKSKDMLDSENEIRFDHMKFNNKISASTFNVKLPKGVPVVTSNSL